MTGYFHLASSAAGRFTFNLKAGNHEVILTSQSYTSKQDALKGIESVRANAPIDARFQRKIAKNDAPYFVLLLLVMLLALVMLFGLTQNPLEDLLEVDAGQFKF